MSKVKTLSFWISNSQTLRKEMNSSFYESPYDCPKVTSFEEIDEQLNDALLDIDTEEHRMVKDIKINDVVVHQHNNHCSDTILRTYTIIY
jgi:hypothetical protein